MFTFCLYRNFIQHLDGNWANLADSLRSLHLSENSISEITFNHDEKKHNYSGAETSALSSFPALIEMNHSVEPSAKQQQYKTFSKLKKLVWLDLSNNRIQHLGINTLPKTLVSTIIFIKFDFPSLLNIYVVPSLLRIKLKKLLVHYRKAHL